MATSQRGSTNELTKRCHKHIEDDHCVKMCWGKQNRNERKHHSSIISIMKPWPFEPYVQNKNGSTRTALNSTIFWSDQDIYPIQRYQNQTYQNHSYGDAENACKQRHDGIQWSSQRGCKIHIQLIKSEMSNSTPLHAFKSPQKFRKLPFSEATKYMLLSGSYVFNCQRKNMRWPQADPARSQL